MWCFLKTRLWEACLEPYQIFMVDLFRENIYRHLIVSYFRKNVDHTYEMLCAIWYHLYKLKNKKQSWKSVTFSSLQLNLK